MEETRICASCGQVIDENNFAFADRNGKCICEDCADAWDVCACCGELFRIRDGFDTADGCVCERCIDEYSYCDHCGELVLEADGHGDRYGNFVCDDCFNWSYRECYDCGRIIHEDDTSWDDDDNDIPLCEDCYENRTRGTRQGLNGYGYKPDPLFMMDDGTITPDWSIAKRDGFELGVELETDRGSRETSCIKRVNEMTERFYAKHDGSLDNGIEWVSHPATLVAHKRFVPWGELMRISREEGFGSHDPGTCGLHVHVSAPTQREERLLLTGKIIVFMARHHDTLQRLSRRNGENRYARSIHLPDGAPIGNYSTREASRLIDRTLCDRYMWLNAENDNTLEFRLWRGTLRYESFMAALEVTDAIVRYCSSHNMKEVAESAFSDIYDDDRYEFLREYVDYRGGVLPAETIWDTYEARDGETAYDGVRTHLHVGDRVRISSTVSRALGSSEYAEIMWLGHSVGLSIDGFTYGHDLDGRLDDGSGYYVSFSDIVAIVDNH